MERRQGKGKKKENMIEEKTVQDKMNLAAKRVQTSINS